MEGGEEVAEGGLGGGGADVGAGAGKAVFVDGGAGGGGDGDVDEADGLGGGAAAGAGDAGEGDGVVGAGGDADAVGHGAGGFGADGAAGGEKLGGDAEEADFEGVGVGDDSAEVPVGAAGEAGERAADESAGAGFGRGQGALLRKEGVGEEVDELFHGEYVTRGATFWKAGFERGRPRCSIFKWAQREQPSNAKVASVATVRKCRRTIQIGFFCHRERREDCWSPILAVRVGVCVPVASVATFALYGSEDIDVFAGLEGGSS